MAHAAPAAYAAYLRGRLATHAGEHDEAALHYRLAQTLAPHAPEPSLALAEALFAGGRTADCAVEVDHLIAKWPHVAEAWLLSGRLASADPRAQAKAYTRAVDLAPGEAEPALLLAEAHARAGDLTKQRAALERLASRRPDSAEAAYRLGRLHLDAGELRAAQARFTAALDAAPDHIEARAALAEVHGRAGRADLARATLAEAFDRSGEDPDVGQRLFALFLRQGDRAAALELLAAIDGPRRLPETRLHLGYLHLQIRATEPALAIAAALLDERPTDHAARLLRVRALTAARQRDDAVLAALEVPASAVEYVDARALAAELYAATGRLAEGRRVVDEALAVVPDAVPLLTASASLLEQAGDRAAARAALTELAVRRPHDPDVAYARAALEDRAGDPARAVALMEEILVDDPASVVALNFVGYLLADRALDLARAETVLSRALVLRPDDGYVLDSWGWLLHRHGRHDEAHAVLVTADRLAPDEAEILYHLGEAELALGNAARAEAAFRRALALDPDDTLRQHLEARVRAAAPP